MQKTTIKNLFQLEKKPLKGLMPLEWVVMGYLLFTLIVILFFYTKMNNPQELIFGRLRVVAMTAALWGVYRIAPCRFNRLVRIGAQMGLLAWWYPDTYEMNRLLPNLDHLFAAWEQSTRNFPTPFSVNFSIWVMRPIIQ